jgi:hypothetical protein
VAVISVQDKTVSVNQDPALAASGNDESASAFDMGALPSAVIENTSAATEAASDPVHSCTKSQDSKTLWFKVTAPAPGTLAVRFTNRRTDNGANSGTVMTLYTLTNGFIGNEFGCLVAPQSATIVSTVGLQFTARQAQTYLVEISATTSGAPEGAQVMGGDLVLTATLSATSVAGGGSLPGARD